MNYGLASPPSPKLEGKAAGRIFLLARRAPTGLFYPVAADIYDADALLALFLIFKIKCNKLFNNGFITCYLIKFSFPFVKYFVDFMML